MNVFGQLLHVEDFLRDGVHYRIAVLRVAGGLHGKWSCDMCQMDADDEYSHPSIGECVTATKTAIEKHHRERHGGLG